MAFQQYGNGQQNAGGGDQQQKKKQNFRIGRLYCTDGIIDVGVWCSDKGGVFTTLNAKQAVGKDPSTGGNVYEQKMSGELPTALLNIEFCHAFVKATEGKDVSTINFSMDTGRGSKLTCVSTGSSVKVTISNSKTGERTITMDPIMVGSTPVNSLWALLCEYVKIGYKKALTNKLDPDEFQMAMGEENSEQSGDVPF